MPSLASRRSASLKANSPAASVTALQTTRNPIAGSAWLHPSPPSRHDRMPSSATATGFTLATVCTQLGKSVSGKYVPELR